MNIQKVAIIIISVLLALTGVVAQQPEYSRLKAEAEQHYKEGSYALALELYRKAHELELPEEEARWVVFRIADATWRAQAATQTSDPTVFDQARARLLELAQKEAKDRIVAEASESLGDFFWTRRDSRDWGQGWSHYQQALNWWAGSEEVEFARERYLKIVRTIASPPAPDPYYYYGYHGYVLPLEILDNALKISTTENDRAFFHYLIAMTLRGQGDPQDRASEEFELALKAGKKTDWYDDALFHYAQKLEQISEFPRALSLYRRITTEFAKGETRYFDQAQNQIKNITNPSLNISVSNLFVPESEVSFYLSTRNVKTIQFSLFRVDLLRDLEMSTDAGWISQINTSQAQTVKTWTKQTGDQGDHKQKGEAIQIEEKLPAGAYLIEGVSGKLRARDLILITDRTLVTKSSRKQLLIYFADGYSGAPQPDAPVKVWRKVYENSRYRWQLQSGATNRDGLLVLEVPPLYNTSEFLVVAAAGARQAFSIGYSYYNSPERFDWRIYAFTDRPAYRPAEEVHWKFIARKYDGTSYSNPSNELVNYEITDPRGAKIKEAEVKLNAFGSAWGSFLLSETSPLGEYRVTFYDKGKSRHIGQAAMFRLEEYKLPEFKVAVQTPEENGKKKTFLTGESVQVNIQADYYFGGAVSNATVEVLIYQNPFYHWWHPPHPYPWYYEDIYQSPHRYWYGGGQIIKRETLKTDTTGKATVTFDTPRNSQQDFEYRVEARVTDASRREITANEAVRVTRQRYYVYPRPDHYLYSPQDKVTFRIQTLDANSQLVPAKGSVKLTRDYWYEIWINPEGKEISGKELQEIRDKIGVFPPTPPVPGPGQKQWTLKFRGYEHDEIFTRIVNTDGKGKAELTFTPEKEGYYRLAWKDEEKTRQPVTAETTVWVVTGKTTELGYRPGGVEIIVDKDTFRAGEKAPVMIGVPSNDRYVLFSTEAEDFYSYQLVHVTGSVKLVELSIEEMHVPNFYLSAAMIDNYQLFLDTEQVIVPPVNQFLEVQVKPDQDVYQPQQSGTLTVTTRDAKGMPVSAEVALGMVDESVYYIQQDYAGDPRQFYFGSKRQHGVQTQSMFQQKSVARRLEAKERGTRSDHAQLFKDEGIAGGKVGGVEAAAELSVMDARKSVANEPVASPAAPPPAPEEAPEAAVQVRSDFRSTAFWQPDVVTDAAGQAVVRFKYPDSLTSWKAVARVASATNQFGIADVSTRTRKPLIVRLQAPRFFVVGDTVTISAILNNNTDSALNVASTLNTEGIRISNSNANTTVPRNGERRLDWVAQIEKAGVAKLTVIAKGGSYSDAMEKNYTIYEHGIEKFLARSGKVRSNEVKISLDLPPARRSDEMVVQVTPSIAVTMLDALPYLIDYPYGCTEQTMSRFLPSVITARTMKDLGLPAEQVFDFGGIEKTYAEKTHPGGRRKLGNLPAMTKSGLDRLYDFQHQDGGWGWWKEGESDHFMTAYVVWGLRLAKQAGVEVRSNVLDRAVDFLQKELVEAEEQYDLQAWMLHAVAIDGMKNDFEEKAFNNLWAKRERLNAYTRALLALSAHGMGRAEDARILVRNLENGVKIDSKPDTSVLIEGAYDASAISTAHWGEDGIYWRWSEGGVEATAFALRALLAIDPSNKLVEPVTNWLVKNRRGAQWSSTRDTAIVVLTLNDYLRKSGELKTDLEFELVVNGSRIAGKKITPRDMFQAPSEFRIDAKLIRDHNEIVIRRTAGNGPLYFAANAKFFSLEEPVAAAGNEIFVSRQYFRLVGKPTLLKGYVYHREPLADGGVLKSGDRVEVVVRIEAKNNYEYLVFEDLKPAGLEAVAIRSGESLYAQELKAGKAGANTISPLPDSGIYTGDTRWVYQELRDRKVALFVDKLREGIWEIRYDLRAEVPGKFHALPLLGYAMYVPEIRANSNEVRITVED
ncbi:MG2 domain-containing protein [bacterium]|nr:MG2 domain-containing protein [bacterium]